MPTYSYRCTECGHAFDIRQDFTDNALTECPECSGTLRKIFGNIGITFNGPGFYRTDSRTASTSSSDSTSSSSSTSTGSGTGSTAKVSASAAAD